MERSFQEVKARCKNIMNDEVIINLVDKSSSPTAAFEMIMVETGDQARAKAGRWLAVLRRDHPEEYRSITSNRVTLQQHDTGKEREHERGVYQ